MIDHLRGSDRSKKAEKARDELILDLECKGSAYTSRLTLKEFLERFIQHKESSMAIERSTVSRAVSLDSGMPYVKKPKTEGSCRTIPLTSRLAAVLHAVEKDQRYVAGVLGVKFRDPYVLGTPDPDSKPYHPTRLSKDFSAFCKMNGVRFTFHDLRHTFATIMIAGGTDVRTVASYLGHSNVAMTLNIYAEVDPDAKRAAVSKVDDAFDIDLTGVFAQPEPTALTLEFTAEQLRAMLAEAERREAGRL